LSEQGKPKETMILAQETEKNLYKPQKMIFF